MPSRHIREMLDQYMTEHGLSTAELARRLGVTQPYVWRIRAGTRRPSPELAQRMEAETGIPAMQLMLGDKAA